ncbi:hypothetical protein ACB098_10G040500 [Castanea mollissima]
MINPIPDRLKDIWDEWNIRAIILVSLSLQTILILFAPFRKRIPKKPVILLIWSSYLLADWAASFAIEHIANTRGNKGNKSSENADLLAFWAPFVLLHLGGPDPISAFALEDNELWLRHLFSLLVQVIVTGYVFLLTLPGNKLLVPTLLMFVAGIIKYFERTRALFLASLDRFRESMLKAPDAGPNYGKLMEEYSSKKEAGLPTRIEMTPEPGKDSKLATAYFNIFKGLIVELIFSFRERNESREFFLRIDEEDALKIIDLELNFIYEALYTTVVVVHNKIGYAFRAVSVGSVVAAFVIFARLNKICGAICLDFIALIMLIFSDWTMAAISSNKKAAGILVSIAETYLKFKKMRWFKDPTHKGEEVLGTCILIRRWSECVSSFYLIKYCLRLRTYPLKDKSSLIKKGIHYLSSIFECCLPYIDKVIDYLGARELVTEWRYVSSQRLPRKLRKFIFDELNRKSEDAEDTETTKRICSARGAYVIQEGQWEGEVAEVYQKITEEYIENVTFEESLLLWHVATELCFQNENTKVANEGAKSCCKLLSDYMIYLLVMRPTMMSAVAGIGQIRFRDTCAEAEKFLSRRALEQGQVNEACKKILEVDTKVKPVHVKGDRSKSILFDACMLAKELNKLDNKNNDNDDKWKMISKVWVAMLSYAATHCRPATHAQQLLMAHFGLGEQFQINEGHARAKLIVGK